MTRIIAIANRKGGVGKTTTVINLGVALAQMKQKVLVLDLDPQGALSAGLGINASGLDDTIYTVLMDNDYPISRVVQPVQAYLDLIPANADLSAAEIELIPEIRRELVLRRVLEPLNSWYDFVLIDCPPSLNLLTINALCASQEVIIPLQCEHFATRGIQMMLDTINRIKDRLNPELELRGILATMYSTGTIHAREVLEEIRSTFGDKIFDVIIYKSIRFAEASEANKAIVEHSSKHKGAKAYIKLAKIILDGTADEDE
ncbi:MAG: ParA family protein [Anaerolineae bacterium]|nr:ParA family protein [Anaerolineae bacterium]